MNKHLKLLENVFTVVSLFLYTGAILLVVISGGYSEGDPGDDVAGDYAVVKQIFIVIDFITIVLLVSRWKKVIRVIGRNKYILIFTAFAICSTIWSDAPDKTLSRAIGLLGTNLFGLYLATRYTMKEQLIILVQTFGTILVLSIFFIVFLPKYGIMGGVHIGAWRGLYGHKNASGRMMVMSALIFFLQSISYNKNPILINLGLAFSIFLLLMTKSSSSMGNLFIIFIMFLIFRTWRWRLEIMIPVSIAVLFTSIVFKLWFDENAAIIFSSFNKDPSLTGRTELWMFLIEIALRRPWLGYAYDTFWLGFDGPSAEVWYFFLWHPPTGHNGFLDLWLTLGLVGLILLIASFFDTLFKGFIWLRYFSKTPDGFWPLIFMVFLILSNLTESSLMRQNEFSTVIYTAISYSLIIGTSSESHLLETSEEIPQLSEY